MLFQQLETWLADITGFSAVSLQPNAGSQGEYAGLMVIRAYQEQRGQEPTEYLPHSGIRSRDESSQCGDCRFESRSCRL